MQKFLAKIKKGNGKTTNLTIDAEDSYDAKKKAEEHGKIMSLRLIV